MTREKFFETIGELLEMPEPLHPDADLEAVPTFDSLGMLNLIEFFDSLGVATTPETFRTVKTGADLLALAGEKVAA